MQKLFFLLLLTISYGVLNSQDFKTYEQSIPGTSITFKMAAIPAGKFKIGSPVTERGRNDDEGPQKEIELSGVD